MKKALLILILIVPIAMSAQIKDEKEERLESAFKSILNFDSCMYEKSFQTFKELSSSSDSRYKLNAEYGLGVCYYNGLGVEKNLEHAYYYFHMLVNNGYDNVVPDCGYFYAECCYKGEGTEPNTEKAKAAYYHSALCGSVLSRLRLGELMIAEDKNIIPYDSFLRKEVFDWVKEEAEKNDYRAQYIIGHLYLKGISCDKNEDQSLLYLNKSADQGFIFAIYDIVHLFYYNKDCCYVDYNKAFLYIKKLAEKDEHYSQYELANCYRNGVGTEKNIELALKWYEQSAKACPKAMKTLGDIYYDGDYLQKDYNESLKYYYMYISHKNDRHPITHSLTINILDDIYSKIGDIYYEGGFGVEQNYDEAVKWFQKAESDYQYTLSPKSSRYYGICYKWGYGGLLPSKRLSEKWLKRAADLGDKIAKQLIGSN